MLTDEEIKKYNRINPDATAKLIAVDGQLESLGAYKQHLLDVSLSP